MIKLPQFKSKKNLEFYLLLSIPILIVVSTVVIIVAMLTFLRQGRQIGAVEFSDTFTDSSYIDIANSTDYEVTGGQVKAESVSYVYGNGSDGACTVSSNMNIHTQSCVGRANGDAVDFSVTSSVSAGSNTVILSSSPTGLAVGDEILIINLFSTTQDGSNVGKYDTAYITGIDVNTLTLDRELENGYDGTTQKIIVQRVPQYTNVTVDEGYSWTPSVWNGTKGGVLFFRASGTVTISGTISAVGKGYSGGTAGANYGSNSTCGLGSIANVGKGGYGGRVYTGDYNGYAGVTSGGGGGGIGVASSPLGSGGSGTINIGASGGGAGGAAYERSSSSSGYGGGGGGGGHGTGGYGGQVLNNGTATNGSDESSGAGRTAVAGAPQYAGSGGGGKTFGINELSLLTFGGGGGAGGAGYHESLGGTSNSYGGNGGKGGGVVFIMADSIGGSGSILAKGNDGGGIGSNGVGGSGAGGAGGAIKIIGGTVDISSATVSAAGGLGATSAADGGNGGSGRIRIEYITSLSGTSIPSASSEQLPAYSTSLAIQSLDLVSGDTGVGIESFVYNLSSKPTDTTATIQFSINTSDWYSSAGVLGESDTLTTGVDNEIDLSGLTWQSATFYYKIAFGTNGGVVTPVLDDISLVYESSPNIPAIGSPTPLSISSIRWNFTDNSTNESGFKLFGADDSLIDTVETQDLSYIDELGLSTNTQYTRKVVSYNYVGTTDYSSTASVYTLTDVPTLSAGVISISTIPLSSGNTFNLTSDSSGLYFDCLGAGCDSGINEWLQTDTDTATGLSANTQYSFTAKARNGDSVETSESSTLSVYTLANIPTISVDEVTTSTVVLNAANTNNISSGSSGLYFDCTGESCDSGINSWIQASEATAIALSPNTQYTFGVKARNGDSTETTYSDTQSIYTLANIPGTPSKSDSTPTSLDLTLNVNSNPSNTVFAVEETSTGKYVNKDTGVLQVAEDWGTYSEFVSGGVARVTGLTAGTTYQLRMKAKNGDDVETTFSTSTSAKTKVVVTNIPVGITALIPDDPTRNLTTDGVDSNSYNIRLT
ncbi:MAG: hypothetical protein ABIC57_01245, partial [bacterium]